MKLLKLFSCILFAAVLVQSEATTTVKLTLFYETLCPYSIKFVKEQLYTATLQYYEYLNLDLVPFGNAIATRNGDHWNIECQHGIEECYGNRVHACALDQKISKGIVNVVSALNCFMHYNYTDSELLKCCQKSKLNYERLKRCMTTIASDLEMKYANRTIENDPKIEYVPMLMFNGSFNKTLEDEAVDHSLQQVICDLLGPEAPDSCSVLNLIK